MRRSVFVLVVGLSACSGDSIAPDVGGSPSDLRTVPGSYDGYRVSYPCSDADVDVGVEGLGANPVTTVSDVSRIGGEILASLADVPSVWGGAGYGVQCHAGRGTSISLDDWRDVDRVTARIGALLRERDLALEVAISVGPVPVAAAN